MPISVAKMLAHKQKLAAQKQLSAPKISHGPNNSIESTPEKYSYRLFIDSMRVGFNIEGSEEAEYIFAKQCEIDKNTHDFQRVRRIGIYNRCYKMKIWSVFNSNHHPILMFHLKKDVVVRIAIYLQPVDLGVKGMAQLHEYIVTFLGVAKGWGMFIERGVISELEVTVDLVGIAIGDTHPLPTVSTCVEKYSTNGKLETLYQGKKKGSFYRVYDKVAERKSKGQNWLTGEKTRVERVLRNQNIKLKDLANISNPFSSLMMLELPLAPPDCVKKKEYIWSLFCDSVRVRGMQAALKLLPETSYRTRFRRWIKNHKAPYWQPEAIWKSWKPMLSELQILNPSPTHAPAKAVKASGNKSK